ncbi:hypothetical protein HOU00_gp482 [Caulobacter phage CcrPW]|uniref:Uncharacterized protein n=1 Tax=Caulobacter phage CcrPW TaxID=2283271 RepID=A0A385EA08_9CAUD|nr:hypothetical protein HOU00_gp482 [Caulobacter phage CcrPW]AXQ68643.1 hypothetical protein CcrPW_gp104c [Caulobacter phage CcrPW]
MGVVMLFKQVVATERHLAEILNPNGETVLNLVPRPAEIPSTSEETFRYGLLAPGEKVGDELTIHTSRLANPFPDSNVDFPQSPTIALATLSFPMLETPLFVDPYDDSVGSGFGLHLWVTPIFALSDVGQYQNLTNSYVQLRWTGRSWQILHKSGSGVFVRYNW